MDHTLYPCSRSHKVNYANFSKIFKFTYTFFSVLKKFSFLLTSLPSTVYINGCHFQQHDNRVHDTDTQRPPAPAGVWGWPPPPVQSPEAALFHFLGPDMLSKLRFYRTWVSAAFGDQSVIVNNDNESSNSSLLYSECSLWASAALRACPILEHLVTAKPARQELWLSPSARRRNSGF